MKRRHKLLTKYLIKRIPPLYFTEKEGIEAVAVVKFFSPYLGWRWFVTEFDGKDIFFGYLQHKDELGYFSLKELEKATVFGNIPAVERDLYFEPTPLKTIRQEIIEPKETVDIR